MIDTPNICLQLHFTKDWVVGGARVPVLCNSVGCRAPLGLRLEVPGARIYGFRSLARPASNCSYASGKAYAPVFPTPSGSGHETPVELFLI